MAKKKVLIITHTKDNASTDKVVSFINDAGSEAVRFNVDRYPMEQTLTTCFSNNQWQVLLTDGATTHELNDVSSVWYPRSSSFFSNFC